MDEVQWYEAHGCEHAHCPRGCPKPQPQLLADGRMICGRCAAYAKEAVEVVPCTPETCEDRPWTP
jgi:hypothetical protein